MDVCKRLGCIRAIGWKLRVRLPKAVSKHKSTILMLLGLVAFIMYLAFFVGLDSLFQLISQLNFEQYSLYYSIAIAALLLSIVFDSLIWHSLLQGLKVKLSLKKVVVYNWIGNFVEMVVPCETVCGEVTRIYLAKKETKQNVGATAAPIITSRILSTFVYTGGLLIGSLVLLSSRQMPPYLVGTLLLVAAGSLGLIGIVLFLALKESAAEKLVKVAMIIIRVISKDKVKQEKQQESLRLSLYSFGEAFRTYKRTPRLLIKPFIYAIVAWLFTLLVYLMVFYSLNFTAISLVDLALVYCVSSTVETITAGFPVGAVEITMITFYTVLGVPILIASAATTLTRLLTFWFQIIAGYPIFHLTGLKQLLKGGFSQTLLETTATKSN
ncbi:MAG: flippase-like domain-containing protein [Candidatus Bathyarchaeota archaeon]|nr:flippase-like domain-containing protein [Candidatus Bathyarchaeota archaeon]